MCQILIQFCSNSTKPLILTGSFFTLLLSIGIGYLACDSNSLYRDIDPTIAQNRSLAYYLQLLASVYLILITLLACFAAQYDQKHSIRALALITSLNFLVAVAAILIIPTGNDVSSSEFSARLQEALKLYDFKDKPPVNPIPTDIHAANGSLPEVSKSKQKRMTDADGAQTTPLNSTTSTQLWDKLQARGCCGIHNVTDWTEPYKKLPKSCCSDAKDSTSGEYICASEDNKHKRSCLELLGSASLQLLIMTALIALVNLYLATVTGISAYRTFHYNEASQNAYS